jgi:hypothetical protein
MRRSPVEQFRADEGLAMPKKARVALSVVPVGAPAVDLAAELISASDPTEKLRSILVNARHIRVNDCGLPSCASTEGAAGSVGKGERECPA